MAKEEAQNPQQKKTQNPAQQTKAEQDAQQQSKEGGSQSTAEEKFDFNKAYQELEEINNWFQQEDIDLEEAVEKYKKGMELVRKCKESLKEAENKFEEIRKEYSIQE